MAQKYEQFINRVKEAVHNQPIPPHYNPDEWKRKSFNCYLYAMRACMNFRGYERFIVPGFISRGQKNDYRDIEEITLQYFIEDCESLGLQAFPSEVDEPIGTTEYKIAVYVKTGSDFHFARQDSDGKWSEKNGWRKGIEILKEEEVDKDQGNYIFIGIFKVSKKVE